MVSCGNNKAGSIAVAQGDSIPLERVFLSTPQATKQMK
jgi:hypothetical protein